MIITAIHVHHAVIPAARYNGSNGPELVREIRRMHRARWGTDSDCAYHFIVFPDGEWERGRPIERRPASATGHNGTSAKHPAAICLYGDLRTDPITDGYVKGVQEIRNSLEFIYDDLELIPHHAMGNTFCPMRPDDWREFVRRCEAG